MVSVTVLREWTDASGVTHPKDAELQIPASLAQNLVAEGWVRWTERTPPPHHLAGARDATAN
jgi:hypothetical protein